MQITLVACIVANHAIINSNTVNNKSKKMLLGYISYKTTNGIFQNR